MEALLTVFGIVLGAVIFFLMFRNVGKDWEEIKKDIIENRDEEDWDE